MNVTIKPGVALQDATQIDTIINQIREDMRILDETITNIIPEKVQTSWSEELLNGWKQYYNREVDVALEEMAVCATNLRMAVDKVLEYSNEI